MTSQVRLRLATTAMALMPAPAFAQSDTSDDGAAVQSDLATPDPSGTEIVVTATKRAERLADIPLAVTATPGERLEQLGVSTTEGLVKVVPSLTVQTTEYGIPVFTIRGVGFKDYALAATPAVTSYVDQVSLPFSAMTRGATLDLERVEVLKGPQGTLFGQNATGGAINYIAAKPTNTFHAGATASFGRFDRVELEGYVSGPLGSNVAARLAVRHEAQGPWQKSFTRDDKNGRANFNNARLLVDFEPTNTLSFRFAASAWRDRSETQAPQFQKFTPSRPIRNALNFGVFDALTNYPRAPENSRAADWDENFDLDRDDRFHMFSLHGDWDISPALTLSSITGYSKYKTRTPVDADGTDYPDLQVERFGDIKSFSQELRLSGESGPLRYMIGGNYEDQTTRQTDKDIFFSSNVSLGPYYFPGGQLIGDQWIETKAVFASVDYKLTPELILSGSARYTDQNRHYEGCFADYGDGAAALAFSLVSGEVRPNGACLTLDDATFKSPDTIASDLNQNNFAWRGAISWKPDRDTIAYASLARGYKAGSYTVASAVFASQLFPVTQESVLAYEIGFKTAFLNGLGRFNSAAFYYDYTDKQLTGSVLNPFFGSLSQLINIPKSRIYGFEADISAEPLKGLRLMTSVTYVNSKVQENPRPPAQALDPLGRPNSFIGESFPNTPDWNLLADAEYRFPASAHLEAFFGGNVSYRSKTASAFGEGPEFGIDDYALVDLRAGIESPSQNWRVQLYGRNVTNKYYWTGVPRNLDTVVRFAGQPATYGVMFSYRY